MRSLRKVSAVLALVWLLMPAAMACMAPEAPLTAAERQCCRRMAHHCGAMGNRAHSCCRAEAREAAPALAQRCAAVTPGSAPATSVQLFIALHPPQHSVGEQLATAHAPPARSRVSIQLRI